MKERVARIAERRGEGESVIVREAINFYLLDAEMRERAMKPHDSSAAALNEPPESYKISEKLNPAELTGAAMIGAKGQVAKHLRLPKAASTTYKNAALKTPVPQE